MFIIKVDDSKAVRISEPRDNNETEQNFPALNTESNTSYSRNATQMCSIYTRCITCQGTLIAEVYSAFRFLPWNSVQIPSRCSFLIQIYARISLQCQRRPSVKL